MDCISCKQKLDFDKFEKRSDTSKYRNQCKKCRNAYVKKYKADIQSEKTKKREIIVIKNTKECIKCKQTKPITEFHKRNTNHGYRHECKKCKQENLYKYYQEVYNEKRREQKRNDIQYKLICNHRLYIYKCLTQKNRKTKRSLLYLGCTLETLQKWLEFQFTDEMNWENYGKYWTIDHILPLSKFDFKDDIQINIAFNWKNLQPSIDNFEKSNNIRLYEYFNSIISAHRFIKCNDMKSIEYQTIRESISWLREKLRYGKNLEDENDK